MSTTIPHIWPKITLEQWSTLVAVVDEGSFAKAAEALNKSQSAISYAIARLNEQLPVPALEAQGRRAVLTEEGRVMYRHAKQLLNQANILEQTAQYLAQGWETQITLAVDAIIPIEPILEAMGEFGKIAPQTRIVLLETTLSGTDEALLERRANFALSARIPTGFFAQPIGETAMIAVARADHPLALLDREISEQELRQHRQIVVRDSGMKRNQDRGWLESEQRFTVSHFSTSIKAIENGLGFAHVPIFLVFTALQQGVFKRLRIASQTERRLPVYLIQGSQEFVGPAIRAFTDILQKQFAIASKPEH